MEKLDLQEERKKTWREIWRLYDGFYLQAQKYFFSVNAFHQMEILGDDYNYTNFIAGIDRKDRLEPSGKKGGLMFIGTNPGQASSLKDLWGDPYGKYFGRMLDAGAIDRDEIWMTNLYKKVTPENRPLEPKEIEEGMKELRLEIKFVKPDLIVALGRIVCQALEADFYMESEFEGFDVLGLPHPSYIDRRASIEEKRKFISKLFDLTIMTRREFVSSLRNEGKTEEEIIEALVKGDEKNGVKPVKAKTPEIAKKFASLILRKLEKEG